MSREKIGILEEFPSDFPRNRLPTKIDVIKSIYFKHYKQEMGFKSVLQPISKCIQAIWLRVEIPVVSERAIEIKLETCLRKFQNLLKHNVKGGGFQSKYNQFNVSSYA